ncbi:MAG: transglycosylase domain-containing protein [Nitrospirales bacterium]|nr:transglycosylase domain-containing protein [Nitrospirales bacterium]MBA3964368.1 transglycosylase domain-containing protein [Nitrospirales bacterium]
MLGFEPAAQCFFLSRPPHFLWGEGARLAAVIPSPLRHQLTENTSYVEKKTNLILRRISIR